MARIDELRLLTRVSRMYYEAGLKQPEIAARLALSQPKVSRLLREVSQMGLVRISVGVPTGTFPQLEERLELRHGLEEASTAEFDNVTLALVGIGAVEPSRLLASSGNVFSAEELETGRGLGGVGDNCLRFFTETGEQVRTPLVDRVIGITLAQLRRAPRAVGVAGGSRKLSAIRGALAGRWINCLITDRFTAERLLDLPDDRESPGAADLDR
jgi:DNA-binding transcriptional regulator LsrR (DeoR family)